MQEGPFSRLLDLVRRELSADDARVEIGGKDPDDQQLVWCRLPNGWRLVAVFSTPPERPEEVSRRLAALAEAFSGITSSVAEQRPPLSGALASRRLDDELEALAVQAGTIRAVVIDQKSPVVWGSSESRRSNEDVEMAIRTAGVLDAAERANVKLLDLLESEPSELSALLERQQVKRDLAESLSREVERIRERSARSGPAAWHRHLLTARAVAAVRANPTLEGEQSALAVHEEHFGYLVRPFAVIYRLILVFEGTFSELHAEAATIHALPTIERLVLALPPVEPPPKAGRVLRLPMRRVR